MSNDSFGEYADDDDMFLQTNSNQAVDEEDSDQAMVNNAQI